MTIYNKISEVDLQRLDIPRLLFDMTVDLLPKGMLRKTLRALQTMPRASVAQRLGIRESSVRQNEWRALRLARKLVANDPVLRRLFEILQSYD